MRYLYLDTSSSFLYAGIVENKKVLVQLREEMGGDLSKITLLKISEMFKSVSLEPNDIDKIIVVNGPGSFTGIRVGITIAKTYAWGLKKDITTINSLEAMAISTKANRYKIPVIDARRNYVYAAIYDKENNIVLKERHIHIDKLKEHIEKLDDEVLIITNDDLELGYNSKKYEPNILAITPFFKDKENINPHLVNPEYLKLTEAEEKNKKDDRRN